MSSVTWSFDESVGEEGRGYADDAAELFSSVGSSILGSVEGGDQPLTWEVAGNTSAEVVGSSNETEEEGEVEIEIDAIGEWDGVTTAPPPTVPSKQQDQQQEHSLMLSNPLSTLKVKNTTVLLLKIPKKTTTQPQNPPALAPKGISSTTSAPIQVDDHRQRNISNSTQHEQCKVREMSIRHLGQARKKENMSRKCRLAEIFAERSNEDLRLDLQRATGKNKDLVKERDALLSERLTIENNFLGDEICNEHLLGFEKGISEYHYFFKVPLDQPGYDIMKTLVDRQLVTMSLPAETEVTAPPMPSVTEEPQRVEDILNSNRSCMK
ncbi:hypothetical protein LR48_Vigan03g116800 [Vigna angularis]|uniref:Uncharacterized protein n=1 Tax=Phaseolus angularis TaxID=3914 RepID=A0A0L9U4S9_PHAAN|nr:hypothetical protein LR48_Vigan03g116800 [Vigna angularis]